MNKFVKILLLTITALIVLTGLTLAVIFLVIDPNRYKPTIESVFAEQTDLNLNIAGDIDWSFRPVFGLSLQDVRVTNSTARMELASLASLSIKVKPWALLDGRLEMEEFVADGLHVNWLVDANGISNWQTTSQPQGQTPSPVTSSGDSTAVAANIEQITISNASLAIQDIQRGINASFSDFNLNSRNTNVENRPFPFEMSFKAMDYVADEKATVSMASTATIDLENGNARFSDLSIKLNPLQLTGELAVEDFNGAMSWRGNLQSNTFTLSDFIANYLTSPEDESLSVPGDYSADSDQFSMQVDFDGNDQQINVPRLVVNLDEMHMNANASYTIGVGNAPANLRYNLTANALDLNRYTSSQQGAAEPTLSEEDTEAAAAAVEDRDEMPIAAVMVNDIELPIDTIKSMNVQGSQQIESLAIAGLSFTNISVALTVQDGHLNLNVQPVGFYGGQITSNTSFDTTQSPPTLTTINSVSNVNLPELAQSLPAASFAEGRLNLESVQTLRGRSVNQMLDTIDGTTSFSIADNAIDIGIVKQLFSSISVLSPTGSGDLAQQWPDVVRFSSLAGHLIFNEGLKQGQEFKVNMDNFEITAGGGIDLTAETFDYDVVLTIFGEPALQTIPVAPLYQGVGWPVACSASFDSEFSQYCGPDFGKVRELFVQISRNQVERRVQDAVTEKVPEELRDSARGLLNRIFR